MSPGQMLFAINFTEQVPSRPAETYEEMIAWLGHGGDQKDVEADATVSSNSKVSVPQRKDTSRLVRYADCILGQDMQLHSPSQNSKGSSGEDEGKVSGKRRRTSPSDDLEKTAKQKRSKEIKSESAESKETTGVLVTSLSPLVDSKILRQQFKKCGSIVVAHVWAKHDDDTTQYGYLEFADTEGRANARHMKGLEIAGRRIEVREVTFGSLSTDVREAVDKNRMASGPRPKKGQQGKEEMRSGQKGGRGGQRGGSRARGKRGRGGKQGK